MASFQEIVCGKIVGNRRGKVMRMKHRGSKWIWPIVVTFVMSSQAWAGESGNKQESETVAYMGFGFGMAFDSLLLPSGKEVEIEGGFSLDAGAVIGKHLMVGGEITHWGSVTKGFYLMGVEAKLFPFEDLGLFLKISGGLGFYTFPYSIGDSDEHGGGFRAGLGYDFHKSGEMLGTEIELGYGVLFLSGEPLAHGDREREQDDLYKVDALMAIFTFSIHLPGH